LGVAGLGQYGLKLLHLLSGCPIIAVDVSESKLARARELGAALALDGRSPEIGATIKELTRGEGVAAAFDFAGTDSTLALAVGSTRSLGKVTQIGLAGGTARLKVLESTAFEVLFEATLWGTIKELREVIALAESGRLSPIPIEVEPLDRINEVYDRLKRGQVDGRIVVRP
jgi:propanol-preferring alcohol dehydrogenase